VPNDLQFRRATLADRGLLFTLHRSLYIDHRDKILPPEIIELVAYRDFDTVLREDIEALLKSEQTIVLIGHLDGDVVGYISARIQQEPRRLLRRRGVIEDWYVEEEHRGKGYGGELLKAIEASLLEAGCEVLESATWSFNEGARRVHESLGFSEVQIQYRKRLESD